MSLISYVKLPHVGQHHTVCLLFGKSFFAETLATPRANLKTVQNGQGYNRQDQDLVLI